jgi:hypothetical protein
VQGGGTTDVAPGLASLGQRLYAFAKGINNALVYANSEQDGHPFGSWASLPGFMKTQKSIATAPFSNRLFVMVRGNDLRVYYVSAVDGQPFGKWLQFPSGGVTDEGVTAAPLGQRLYMFSVGLEGHVYANSAELI